MPAVAMIFNGLHVEQAVADKAFAFAKQNGDELIAIFLKVSVEKAEGYGYPSDLGAAETLYSKQDEEKDDRSIVHSYQQLLEHEAAQQKIPFQSHLLEDPTAEQVQALLQECKIIFIQRDYERNSLEGINVKKILHNNSIPLELVP